MTHPPRRPVVLLLAACAAVLLGGAVPALAGAPKSQRVVGFARERSHGALRAELTASGRRLTVTLAQVRVPAVLRLGRACRRAVPAAELAAASHALHLDVAVQLAADRSGTYLLQPRGGEHDRPARSLNALLVERGIATVDAGRGAYRRRLLADQRAARRAGLGAWGCRRRAEAARRSAPIDASVPAVLPFGLDGRSLL